MFAYIGTIMAWPGPRPPRGWRLCDGTLLPISGFDALFAVIGTAYGGDGATNFALPDLRSRIPQGTRTTGGGSIGLGSTGGLEQVPVALANMPAHAHPVTSTNNSAGLHVLPGAGAGGGVTGESVHLAGNDNGGFYASGTGTVAVWTKAIDFSVVLASAGVDTPKIATIPQFTATSYIICIEGGFPSFN